MVDRSPDTLTLALKLLAKELQARLQKHPGAQLLNGQKDSVELRIRIPTTRPYRGWLDKERESTSEALTEGLRQILLRHAICRSGHVLCLRCESADCDHSVPSRSTEVFAGYSPSGEPRFLDFGQWLLDRRDPRVDLLYKDPPVLLAHRTEGTELTDSLLPAFRDRDSGYRIHGQVAAGWYAFPSELGFKEPLALTFQLISTQPSQSAHKFGLNLIGVGPNEQPLENLYDLTGEIPWIAATRWAERTLSQIERSQSRRSKKPNQEQLDPRLQGLLNGLANRLERERRSRARRTDHGHKRHRQRSRPTWKALADLHDAKPDQVLMDTRRNTFVVLGSNGRAHIFNRSAQLVTSVRYSADAIERRRRIGIWKPTIPEEVERLRSAAETTER